MQGQHRPEADVVAQFRRALQLQPDYVNAITQLAVIEMNHGRPDEARRLIEESIRLDPKNPALYKNMGAFCVRLNRPADALSWFQKALELDPDYPDAHHEIAWLDLNQNRLDEARVQLSKSFARLRGIPTRSANFGTLDANLGRRSEGRRLLERAVSIKPGFPRAQTNCGHSNEAKRRGKAAALHQSITSTSKSDRRRGSRCGGRRGRWSPAFALIIASPTVRPLNSCLFSSIATMVC